ncbi:MAG: MarR family winged helix-turn-helix transcriptional regulator [Terrabacter sp.]
MTQLNRASDSDTGTPQPPPGLDNVLFDVWLVSRAATAMIDNAIRAAGLDAEEFAIYSVLASDQGMTPSELARWMAAPPTTVSSYVKRLERRGHVQRTPHPEDRRSYRIHLTATGRAAHQSAGELFLPTLEEVTRRLGSESPEVHRRLLTLHQALANMNAGNQSGQ